MRFIFVMDLEGNLFIHKEGTTIDSARICHASLTGRLPVACAGEISVKEGQINSISNLSGHYRPKSYTFARVIFELEKRKVLANYCTIRIKEGTSLNGHRISIASSSLDAFKTKFNEQFPNSNLENTLDLQDLDEKPNPLKLLNCLTAINSYLKNRAKETGSYAFLTSFGVYDGRDYYSRRNHFRLILDQLAQKNFDDAIQLIDDNLTKFQGGFFRNNYAEHLSTLKALLKDYQPKKYNILDFEQVHNKITAYQSLYLRMEKCTKAIIQHQSASNVHLEDEAKILSKEVKYIYEREALDETVQQEFLDEEEIYNSEYINVTKY